MRPHNTAVADHQTVLSQANRIWRVSGVLANSFFNKVPQGVWQMQYVAREVDVWSTDPADLTKLKTAITASEFSKSAKPLLLTLDKIEKAYQ